jgi:hypothetical protein
LAAAVLELQAIQARLESDQHRYFLQFQQLAAVAVVRIQHLPMVVQAVVERKVLALLALKELVHRDKVTMVVLGIQATVAQVVVARTQLVLQTY